MTSPVTIPTLYEMKEKGENIIALTAYDYPLTRLVDTSGTHMILMGDSLLHSR
ncbi:MAG: 3-methyl-2-oxobutanoate hydroxymethyltransferase [Deltaproteobacteria bacterium]|nr:3-methyl-2-oxobutanoate hydroxymethyltransferase [Deltaproteobacteria bacterium]